MDLRLDDPDPRIRDLAYLQFLSELLAEGGAVELAGLNVFVAQPSF